MINEKCLVAYNTEDLNKIDNRYFIPLKDVMSVSIVERVYELGHFVAIEVSKESSYYKHTNDSYARIPVGTHNYELAMFIQIDIMNSMINNTPVTYVPRMLYELENIEREYTNKINRGY